MNLHPVIVHFPIALLCVAGGLYVLRAWKPTHIYVASASLLHVLGWIGLGLAAISGNMSAGNVETEDELTLELMQNHEVLGFVAIWLFACMYLWQMLRAKQFRAKESWLFAIVFLLLCGLLLLQGHLGGELVYEFGLGRK